MACILKISALYFETKALCFFLLYKYLFYSYKEQKNPNL